MTRSTMLRVIVSETESMSKVGNYLNFLSIAVLSLSFLAFPLVFTTLTTDTFVLPKQILVIIASLLVFILLGVRWIAEKTITIRRTPYDAPILLFLGAVLLSSVLSINRSESLVAFVSLFFAASLYFILVNSAKSRKASFILLAAFIEGAVLLSIFNILTFFKIYILPFSFTRSQLFTPIGSLLDQAIYVSSALALLGFLVFSWKKNEKLKLKNIKPKMLGIFSLVSAKLIVLAVSLGLTIYSLIKLQNPIILPFSTGFQIAFAAVSQDTGRAILSFLLGSGFGTFATDFSRFKLSVFNQSSLWNLTFFRSSSFVLELMATTGVLGLLTFLNLVYQGVKTKPLFLPFAFLVLISFFLPLSPVTQILPFVILGLYATIRGVEEERRYYDVELSLTAHKRGAGESFSRALPFLVFLLILILSGALGFLTYRYAFANKIFQDSLIAASQNKGSDAYTKQSQAISLVSYNDAYQRVFSQTNLALANSLSSSTPKGASPSAQTQQTIYTLIQQSIGSARLATTLSPLTSANWQNLSGVYRSLIGFGKNADAFSILAAQQAISLDPTNPQEYINLGGLYYQLQLWDKAAEQFRAAINLKPDLANAYYNLAHALQQKGDLNGALEQLETVKNLVKNDSTNLKKVEVEIDALKKGLAAPSQGTVGTTTTLPPQNPPVAIPAPVTPKPSPSPSPATAPLGTTPTPTPIPTK